MSSDPSADAEAAVTESPFAFQPPPGGDLTLRSSDGTVFQVHSVLLGLASTVFATCGRRGNDIFMLAFIYPVDPPSITKIDQLEKLMQLSQKYDVQKIIKFIEGCNRPDNQLVVSDPIRVFHASLKHDFPATRSLSAKTLGLDHYDFRSPKGIEELARKFPESSSVIGLMGAQLVRSKLLGELLKGSFIPVVLRPELPGIEPINQALACYQCWNNSHIKDKSRPNWESNAYFRYIPGWLPLWLTNLHDRLIKKPMDPCEDLLNLLFIANLYENSESGCPECANQTLTKRSFFEQWSRDAKDVIDKELKVLDKLYSL
ncbi:hypothetical protein B0J17DRAFT_715450 [Rhizoctonia solani]|nr:hypothetical protein B0J17DRAFT_715450 [Rhizoctonia solani]